MTPEKNVDDDKNKDISELNSQIEQEKRKKLLNLIAEIVLEATLSDLYEKGD